MKTTTLSKWLIFVLLLIFGLAPAQSPIQAGAFDPTAPDLQPASPQILNAKDNRWNLLYIDGLQPGMSMGTEPSLAFDLVSNTPYISYYNNQIHSLVLARYTGPGSGQYHNCGFGEWWCPVVAPVAPSTSDVGLGSSLAIFGKVSSPGSRLGISYYDATFKRPMIAEWACSPGCAWGFYSFANGNSQFDSGRHTSFAYNTLGEPQLAYTFNWNEPSTPISTLTACRWVGSGGNDGDNGAGVKAFSCEDVVRSNGLNCCANPSLALDPINNTPRIAYFDDSYGGLKYVIRSANGAGDCFDTHWYCYTIDANGITGLYPSLKMVHTRTGATREGIAYYDAGQASLKYAYPKQGGNCGPDLGHPNWWQCDTIDSMGAQVSGPSISLLLDDNDPPHPTIAYQDFGAPTKDLKIARDAGVMGKLDGNCGTANPILHPYQCDIIDPGGHGASGASNDGYAPSIARSAAGLLTIAYQEKEGVMGTLKLAYQSYWSFLSTVRK